MKQIYDFVQEKGLRSFHCVSIDYPRKTKLVDFQDRKQIEPNLCIILDFKNKQHFSERKILSEYFPEIEIRVENLV